MSISHQCRAAAQHMGQALSTRDIQAPILKAGIHQYSASMLLLRRIQQYYMQPTCSSLMVEA